MKTFKRAKHAALMIKKETPMTDMKEKFNALMKRWRNDTRIESSATKITTHPAYLEIIKMGEDALPLIFEDIQNGGCFWGTALNKITGEDPIAREDWGKISKISQTWLEWGREHGYVES